MKKLLLASVAVSGLALAAAPAYAEVNLELGGYFKGYGAFSDTDANDSSFDIIRDTELHVGGETTLDNGLTIGAHFEIEFDGADTSGVDESYLYFSGDWGRVNIGEEDGAVYLLQVAAPSADSNLDGIRQYISPFAGGLDYALDTAKDADKFTYLSPIFGGFQIGASYASKNNAASSVALDTTTDSVLEAAVRYEGQFQNVGVIAGAGYESAEDDADGYNVGLDLDIAAFGLGAAFVNQEIGTTSDTDTIVVGADYTTGPFKIGATYFNADESVSDVETDRYTAGVVYNYGPGMSFRGSVQYQDEDTAGTSVDGTAVVIGTQVNF